jgi:hypothetical protein
VGRAEPIDPFRLDARILPVELKAGGELKTESPAAGYGLVT